MYSGGWWSDCLGLSCSSCLRAKTRAEIKVGKVEEKLEGLGVEEDKRKWVVRDEEGGGDARERRDGEGDDPYKIHVHPKTPVSTIQNCRVRASRMKSLVGTEGLGSASTPMISEVREGVGGVGAGNVNERMDKLRAECFEVMEEEEEKGVLVLSHHIRENDGLF
ncbi:hypothetical protein K435DRAFT_802134 [Dendrothele bispora CBS 962.96]|uniref:Uncharacterized protein n=1 Tax=Dendrothele bispora (strain CBS 962.96) TaxID=1314807 RepID=A0A4S8LM18_DENBC|nr:hypothetical protein K435DRAFT_802134 [Dendrothele bispora CBS 962.96]